MTIYLLAKNELGWLGEECDFAQWKHLAEGFKVDGFSIIRSIDESALKVGLKRVFLEPPANQSEIDHDFIDLKDYVHPEECIYVFGNTASNNLGHIRPEDDIVTIFTPYYESRNIFSISIAGMVLYDRLVKG